MNYPLEVGGVDDYPVKVGSMLLTLVDPSRGYELAYNRWYERDHFYGGCMIGPWLFAGSRWVATRDLKDRRWPQEAGPVAAPYDAGSFIAVYWVEKGHHDDHFEAWAVPQVRDLYANGRGFAERRHVHTSLFDHIGSSYRDEDPVPIDLALDRRYSGLVVLWWDAPEGTEASDLHRALGEHARALLGGSAIEIASSWTPSAPDEGPRDVPMDLGSPAGGPNRLVQLLFVDGDVAEVLGPVRTYTDAVEAEGLGRLQLAAPFFSTVVGTDTYVDQLW
ncbi:MAG TPA: hypothetical protein VG226_05165 [Acidimicrobiales bacterium]|nr:hypothetical protein [Acidimicrobiales bacterium]